MKTNQIKKTVNVSIGVTATYIALGLFLIGLAIYMIYNVSIILAFPVFYLGFLALLTIRGFTIDVMNKSIRKYIYFFPVKIGTWQSIQQYNKIVLALTHDTTEVTSGSGIWIQRSSVRTRHFEIYLTNEKDEKLELIDYPDYKTARTFLKEIAVKINLEAEDLFEESVLISRTKRHWTRL